MAIQMYVYWSTLLRLAHEEAEARKSGDEDAIARAAAKHADYQAVCRLPDVQMVLPGTRVDWW
jgi:hypothetical protein